MTEPDRGHIEASIAALEAQRAVLGDDVVAFAIARLRDHLGDDVPPPPRLRQISALFVDIVGSTAMAQHLDPESAGALLGAAMAGFTAAVRAQGGRVLRYMGDGLFAAFGIDRAHEDDAAQAVRAGLALHAEAARLGASLAERHGIAPLQVRVGIDTGLVLIGGGVEAENSVAGMTINIAARMEQTAPPGALRITHATYRQVRGLFEVTEQPPLQVKGHDAPLQTYLVHRAVPGALPQARRGVVGVATPLIGRERELAALQAASEALTGHRRPAAVWVVGEAGLGKTRLLDEFRQRAATWPGGVRWCAAQAGERHTGRPYGLLRDLFDAHLRSLHGPDASADAQQPLARRALAAARPVGRPDDAPAAPSEDRPTADDPAGPVDPLAAAHAGRSGDGPAAEADDLPAAPSGRAGDGPAGAWLSAVAPLLESGADAAVLGHVLGFDFSTHPAVEGIASEARQLRDRAFHYALRYWHRAATEPGAPPLVLLLDDLHWADAGSLDFVDHLLGAPEPPPLLLVGLTRPDTAGANATERGRAAPWTRIELTQLDAERSAELADALLTALDEVPGPLRDLLTRGADGNPFYMEELVNMLIDRGAIVTGGPGERWQVDAARLTTAEVPATLTGVLQARLDALPAAARAGLQLASVIGPAFWDDALRLLDPAADAALPLLMERQFVVPHERSSLEGQREYGFRHHALHQVCYATALKRVRRPAHARIAAWLEGQPGTAHLDAVAEHWERGGDLPRAATGWQRAAEAAAARYANAAALDQAGRALALLPANAMETRYALGVLRAKVLARVGDRDERAAVVAELECMAQALDADAKRSEVDEMRGRLHVDGGDAVAALALARRAIDFARADPARGARAHLLAAQALQRLGRYAEAHDDALAGLALARQVGDRRVEGQLLNQIGMASTDEGDPAAAAPYFEQAIGLHREAQNRQDEAGTLSNLAYVRLTFGDYAVAAAEFDAALALCRQLGVRNHEGIVLLNLALVDINRGELTAAEGHAVAAQQLLGPSGDRWAEAATERVLGLAWLLQGRAAQALPPFVRSRDGFDALGLGHLAMEAMAGVALAHLAMGRLDDALAEVDRLLKRQAAGATLGGTDEPMRVHLACVQVLQAAQDARETAVLESACTELMSRAARIADPTRRDDFLRNVPCHRDLLALQSARLSRCS